LLCTSFCVSRWVAAERYPGELGAGAWYQTGVLHGSPGVSQNGTGGFYLFGGQRFWGRSTESPAPDGKNALPAGEWPQKASISTFVQFCLNNSETSRQMEPRIQYQGHLCAWDILSAYSERDAKSRNGVPPPNVLALAVCDRSAPRYSGDLGESTYHSK
jgi:hypothetical protein